MGHFLLEDAGARDASPPLGAAREARIARALRKGDEAGRLARPVCCDVR